MPSPSTASASEKKKTKNKSVVPKKSVGPKKITSKKKSVVPKKSVSNKSASNGLSGFKVIKGLKTVDKRCLYKRVVNDVDSRHTSASTSSKKDAVYCATNVDGKRKYVVYKGKTVRARQVGGVGPDNNGNNSNSTQPNEELNLYSRIEQLYNSGRWDLTDEEIKLIQSIKKNSTNTILLDYAYELSMRAGLYDIVSYYQGDPTQIQIENTKTENSYIKYLGYVLKNRTSSSDEEYVCDAMTKYFEILRRRKKLSDRNISNANKPFCGDIRNREYCALFTHCTYTGKKCVGYESKTGKQSRYNIGAVWSPGVKTY